MQINLQNNVEKHHNTKLKKAKTKQFSGPNLYFDSRMVTSLYILPVYQKNLNINYSLSLFKVPSMPPLNLEVDLKTLSDQQKQTYHKMIAEKILRSSTNMIKHQKMVSKQNHQSNSYEIDSDQYNQYWENCQNKKYYKSFLPKKYLISDQIIFIQIIQEEQGQQDSDLYMVTFKNMEGITLFYLNHMKIQHYEKDLLKKLQNHFSGGNNLFYIINKGNKNLLNLINLDKILATANDFIYVQKNYHMLNDKIYTQNQNQETSLYEYEIDSQKKIYFVEYGEDTLLFSLNALNLFYNKELQIIMELQNKINQRENDILNQIYIEGQPTQSINIYLKYLIENKIIIAQNQKKSFKFIDIYLGLLKQQREMASDCKKKLIQDIESNYKQHYPKIMDHCKLCKVCNKNSKQNFKNKDHKKKSNRNKMKMSSNQSNGNKIKKTKYSCQGCSIQFKKDVPLCVVCFKQFHRNIQFYLDKDQYYKNKNLLSIVKVEGNYVDQSCLKNNEVFNMLQKILQQIHALNEKFDHPRGIINKFQQVQRLIPKKQEFIKEE